MEIHIKEARIQAGLSQKELAKIIGVAPSTFNGYESGNHDPKSEFLKKIAKACNVSVDFLLGHSLDNEQDEKNSPDTAEATPGENQISLEMSNRLLVALGLIEEGQDLSDDDLAFLTHIVGLLDAWFGKGQ